VRRLPEDDYSLPSAATMAQWDESEFYQKVFLLGKKLKSIGITVDCAPVVDIRSGVDSSIVGDRSFSEYSKVVSQKARIYLEALQSSGVSGVLKHFPGHGTTVVDSHKSLPEISKSYDELFCNDLKPFVNLSTTADFVMIGHLLLSSVSNYPATLSKEWSSILREEVGFNGLTMLDDMEMHALDKWTIEDRVDLFLATKYDLMPVCSGKEETLYLFWEAMVKALEKDSFQIQRCELIGDRVEAILKMRSL